MINRMISGFFEIIGEHAKDDSLSGRGVACAILSTLILIWLGIRFEMLIYEYVVIGAMGAHLNPVSFWSMAGFDLLCSMLVQPVASKKE